MDLTGYPGTGAPNPHSPQEVTGSIRPVRQRWRKGVLRTHGRQRTGEGLLPPQECCRPSFEVLDRDQDVASGGSRPTMCSYVDSLWAWRTSGIVHEALARVPAERRQRWWSGRFLIDPALAIDGQDTSKFCHPAARCWNYVPADLTVSGLETAVHDPLSVTAFIPGHPVLCQVKGHGVHQPRGSRQRRLVLGGLPQSPYTLPEAVPGTERDGALRQAADFQSTFARVAAVHCRLLLYHCASIAVRDLRRNQASTPLTLSLGPQPKRRRRPANHVCSGPPPPFVRIASPSLPTPEENEIVCERGLRICATTAPTGCNRYLALRGSLRQR